MIATRDTDWRTYARERGAGSLACQPAWLDLLRRVYGYEIVPLSVTDPGGAVRGLLPLCRLRSPLTGRRLVSVPFSDAAPLLADDDHAAAELVDRAVALARDEGAKYLELRSGPNALLAARGDFAASELYVRWLIPLAGGATAAWDALHKPVQRQVKKARKAGITVRAATTLDDMLAYHRLHLLTRCRKHGMPAQPWRYFRALWQTFAADGSGTLQVLLAEHAGQVVAGMVLFGAGDTLRYAYGASDPRALAHGPNNLLMWEAIERAAAAGYATLDMGRTARDNEGLMQFKRGWGATLEPLTYYYFPALRGLATTSERSWKFRLATSCWRRLPLGVADTVGGRLYGHLG
ncbi:MAG TPA: GNAT family N-acetyltransferase [Ktedonobacterales bacterium]|nr:GNAT family N-acetyltransferase [Ktedonobacterales bacterium]